MKIDQDIMFVSLSFGLPRQSRKVTAQADIDPARLKASAKLYSGASFKAIKSHDAETRAKLLNLAIAIPSCFRGSYVLPCGTIEPVRALFYDRRGERDSLVSDFIRNDYPQEREAARAALNGSFRESDFPEPDILKAYFRMDWNVFRLEVPEGLPENVKAEERAKFEDQMQSVFVECRAALRETLADLVGHLSDRLAPDADGTRKRLARSTVDNLRAFLDTVNARDITSDSAIRELSDKARAVLGSYGPDDLKGMNVGNRVRAGLIEVKASIDALIERDGGRRIDLDMD